jgi:aminoglycoside phosphotransferase (APT) family kinase protein
MPSPDVLRAFDLSVGRFMGGGHHENWLCHRGSEKVALRRYVRPPLGEVSYEHRVASRLDAAGWPVPVLLEPPLDQDGSTWAIFSWLSGTQRSDADAVEERRDRGAILADLHDTTTTLLDLGQRAGCVEAYDVVADETLDSHLAAYATWFPDEARLMAWHLERCRARFAELDVAAATRIVIHGDFAPWNLLFEGGRLSGVLDLEASHLNLLVADFALAWRGYADEVVLAYDARRALDPLDWELLTPVWWSWLFLGVAGAIDAMRAGLVEPRVLRWTVTNLVTRSPLMRDMAAPYPG